MIFGIECEFTRTLLVRLLDAGVPVTLVCLPGPESLEEPIVQRSPSKANLNLIQPDTSSVTALAHSHGLDVWRVGNLGAPATVERFRSISADLGVVACFTRLIPGAISDSFRLGTVNVHPSLLPDKRGPDPQFWTLKEGLGEASVTVHRLTKRFDAGPVLAQQSLTLPDGATEHDLDVRTASAGTDLLLDVVRRLSAGEEWGMPQDESRVTHAPFPDRDDFRLDRSRPARAAFNFARGVQGRGVPVVVEIDGKDWIVDEAIAFAQDDREVVWPAGPHEMLIEFNPGVLLARVRPADAG